MSTWINGSHILWLCSPLLSSPLHWHSRSADWRARVSVLPPLLLEQPLHTSKPAVKAQQLHTIWAQAELPNNTDAEPNTHIHTQIGLHTDERKKEARNKTWNRMRLNKSDRKKSRPAMVKGKVSDLNLKKALRYLLYLTLLNEFQCCYL